MTKRFVTTLAKGQPAVLEMGWDRPLQRVFASVTLVSDVNEDSRFYDSMSDENLEPIGDHEHCLEYFIDKLLGLGVFIPVKLAEAITLDQTFNNGNVIENYGNHFGPEALKEIAQARDRCQNNGIDPDALVHSEHRGSEFQWFIELRRKSHQLAVV